MAHSKNTRNWTPKEFQKLLEQNGYRITRTSGSHLIFTKQGCSHISIPATNVNMMLARRLIKENNLNTSQFIK